MAEISFPFDEDNEDGGSKVISQTQWQQMSAGWGSDHIDYPLTNSTYVASDLPFYPTVSGREVTVRPGSARVGGFYYQLSESKTFLIPENTSGKPRADLIVLRADMARSAVTMELVQGTPATNPVEPQPRRVMGGLWEMALTSVQVPPNNGQITVSPRCPYPMPDAVAFPWNARLGAEFLPRGQFIYDLDNNNNDSQWEAFNGRDGYVVSRHFGKSRPYTPAMVNSSSVAAANRKGRWRWIAPNTFWFAINISNTSSSPVRATGSNWRIGIQLPRAASGGLIQTAHGYLSNPDRNSGMPNYMSLTATTSLRSTSLWLHFPNNTKPQEGLDGLRIIPAKSNLYISGVMEANEFSE